MELLVAAVCSLVSAAFVGAARKNAAAAATERSAGALPKSSLAAGKRSGPGGHPPGLPTLPTFTDEGTVAMVRHAPDGGEQVAAVELDFLGKIGSKIPGAGVVLGQLQSFFGPQPNAAGLSRQQEAYAFGGSPKSTVTEEQVVAAAAAGGKPLTDVVLRLAAAEGRDGSAPDKRADAVPGGRIGGGYARIGSDDDGDDPTVPEQREPGVSALPTNVSPPLPVYVPVPSPRLVSPPPPQPPQPQQADVPPALPTGAGFQPSPLNFGPVPSPPPPGAPGVLLVQTVPMPVPVASRPPLPEPEIEDPPPPLVSSYPRYQALELDL